MGERVEVFPAVIKTRLWRGLRKIRTGIKLHGLALNCYLVDQQRNILMKAVSGFLSSDGKFFDSEEKCRDYEQKFAYEERRNLVIEEFKSGILLTDSTSLPRDLLPHLETVSGEDITELWNSHLLYLFMNDAHPKQGESPSTVMHEMPELGGSRTTTDPLEFFILKAETAYRLLAFVLGKSL